MAEKLAPVDKNRLRIEDLNKLQKEAWWTIVKKMGSQSLANAVIVKSPSSKFKLGEPKLISLNPDNNEYDGFTQKGIHYQLSSADGRRAKRVTRENWNTDIVHSAGGCWIIKTNCGERKFFASCNPKKEIEIKATLSLDECLRIINECKKTDKNRQRYLDEHVFLYLAELRSNQLGNDVNEEIISATFSSIPGESKIHLPME